MRQSCVRTSCLPVLRASTAQARAKAAFSTQLPAQAPARQHSNVLSCCRLPRLPPPPYVIGIFGHGRGGPPVGRNSVGMEEAPPREQAPGSHPSPQDRLGAPADGAQRGGASGPPVRRRNAETRVQPHFGVTRLGGKTAVARQRGRRPPPILAAWDSPSRWRGRWRVGSCSGPPGRRRNAETRVRPHFGQNAARRQNCRSSATRETTPANPGRPGQPIAMPRSPAGRLAHRW